MLLATSQSLASACSLRSAWDKFLNRAGLRQEHAHLCKPYIVQVRARGLTDFSSLGHCKAWLARLNRRKTSTETEAAEALGVLARGRRRERALARRQQGFYAAFFLLCTQGTS